ncbi:hypothetical protein [Microvirga sp. P5_D2]
MKFFVALKSRLTADVPDFQIAHLPASLTGVSIKWEMSAICQHMHAA